MKPLLRSRCSRLAALFLLPLAALPAAPAAVAPATLDLIHSGRLPPAYPTPYAPASVPAIKATLGRVLGYLETATPVRVIDRDTGQLVTDLDHLTGNVAFARTDFILTSYEWGVTYSGMLLAADATGDTRYRDYVATRLDAIAKVADHLNKLPPPAAEPLGPARMLGLRSVLAPHTLDDSGSMCAAMIAATRAGIEPARLRPWIDHYMAWIEKGQFRFADGTLARNVPFPNTLWLDDLYMSVSALSQMGALTGEHAYFDDAAKQILQFSARMFVPGKGLYRHGWVAGMDPHPAFHWARANGWALMAMADLLSVMPEDHPQRAAILAQYRAQALGLANCQSGSGLWHQLLDRNDTYLETSASAIYVYALARGINRGWLDPLVYGPVVSLGWNAVAQQVNAEGQVENTCVGTGMGFDPMFYYYRPVSVYAAHGYGPVLLAGAEMIKLRESPAGQRFNTPDSTATNDPSHPLDSPTAARLRRPSAGPGR